MRVTFHPEALAEFEDATHYYAEKQAALAQRFIASVEAVLQHLSEHPDVYATLEHDVRRCLTRVFPYAVLYTIEADSVLIVAVMHSHRKPGYWQHRMAAVP